VISTQAPILLGRDVGPFAPFGQHIDPIRLAGDDTHVGFCGAQPEARADLTLVLSLLLLLIVEAGRWAFDTVFATPVARIHVSESAP
jgi:hypothetical protein